jgi:RNA polymerase sigma-70 factor (ECF subfamily)
VLRPIPPRKNRGKAGFWHRRGFAEKELLRECREIATQFLRWRNYLRTSELARPSDSERFVTEGLDDADIVSGLRAGDRDAWGALCQKYGERLWRYVARLVGSDEDGVAEVFQETLMAVARSGRAIRPDTTIWSWLCRIGHNQAALFWRKRYRDKPADHDAVNSLTAADGDPVASLTQRETVESVRGLLAEMNAEHVALLTAKYLDGLTVPQILEAFGGTIEGIRSSLARARRDFRE